MSAELYKVIDDYGEATVPFLSIKEIHSFVSTSRHVAADLYLTGRTMKQIVSVVTTYGRYAIQQGCPGRLTQDPIGIYWQFLCDIRSAREELESFLQSGREERPLASGVSSRTAAGPSMEVLMAPSFGRSRSLNVSQAQQGISPVGLTVLYTLQSLARQSVPRLQHPEDIALYSSQDLSLFDTLQAYSNDISALYSSNMRERLAPEALGEFIAEWILQTPLVNAPNAADVVCVDSLAHEPHGQWS